MSDKFDLFDSLLSPVAVVGGDPGTAGIVYFNQAFAQFFQLPPRKIRGKSLDEVLGAAVKAGVSVEECRQSGNQVVSPEVAVGEGEGAKRVVLKFFPIDGGASGRVVAVTLQDFSIERTLHAKHRLQLDEIKKYSEGLEVLVNERTHELKTAKEETESILRSIGEGIFVIERNLAIGVQCSRAALSLLGRERLQGELAIDALFPEVGRTGMGEVRTKIHNFLASAFMLYIPEQFDDLSRFLPKSIRFPAPAEAGRLAIYSLSFSAVIDDGSILRIVVAVRDDTELEELRNAVVAVHRRVIETLGKVAGLRQGPAAALFVGFLKESVTLIDGVAASLADLGGADVHALFRALHTIKGGARHYGLAFLQHFAHVAETFLDLRRADRSGTPTPASEQQDLAADIKALGDGLHALRDLMADGEMLAAGGAAAWQAFTAGLSASAAQLAGDLGKEAVLAVHAAQPLTGQDLTLCGAVVTHLLRNALDHGLEAPARRQALGKPAQGRLMLTVEYLNGWYFGRFEDDGAGIDYAAVTAKGIARGLVAAGTAVVRPTEALRVLAAPGFSTRDRATEISGRGVGLDVVVTELKRRGGHCAIERSDGGGTSFIFSWKKQEETGGPLSLAAPHSAA